jgi:putative ABC transport system permease protein
MWSVVVGALAARRDQAGVVAMVALLACAAAAAAGWYAAAAGQAVAVATVENAPVGQRLVTLTRPGAPPAAGHDLTAAFHPLEFDVVSGGQVPATLRAGADASGFHPVTLAHRDGVCAHLVVTGDCPAAPGEVLVSGTLAGTLGVATGGQAHLTTAATGPAPVRVVGTYRVVDPFDPYWGDRRLNAAVPGQPAPEVVFTVAAGMGDDPRRAVMSTHDLVVDPGAFAEADPQTLAAAVQAGTAQLSGQGYAVTTELPALIDRVAAERRQVSTAVAAGVVLLLLLTMVTLMVIFRAVADQTRRDAAWWQLRGAPAGHGWTAALAPSVVPLLAGAVPGTAIGAAAGHALPGAGGSVTGAGWRLSAVLVAVTVAGAVLVAVTAQLGTLRTPVRDLLRRVPARHRWGRRLVDVVVVVLVAAAVAQALLAGDRLAGVATVAPGLVGLGLALVAGWALAPLAARAARWALRAGHLGIALAALAVARRPGAHRLFALATAAVALLTVALTGVDTATRGQWQRATVQTGAAQVVTIESTDASRLLAAVRTADPDGRAAMAVVRSPAQGAGPPVLAVDSTRLPVVAGWQDGYGGAVASVAGALRPGAPPPVTVRGQRLAVEASGADPQGRPVNLRVLLRTVGTGTPVAPVAGPLSPERAAHPVEVPECATGCRLVGFELLGTARADGHTVAPDGSWVHVHRLSGGTATAEGGQVVGAGLLGDAGRWRPAVGEWQRGPVIEARGHGLRLTRPAQTPPPPQEQPLLRRDDRVFLVDAPVPVPVVTAGWRPPAEAAAEPRLPLLGGAPVPVHLASRADLLPSLGSPGAMVDLEYAVATDPAAGAHGTAQVWLAPDAPAAVLERLQAAGLRPVRHESVAQHAGRLAADGVSAAARFQVAVGLVVLLLAAGAVLARFAGQHADLAAERAALRGQGVDARVTRTVAYAVPVVLSAAAVATGMAAGLVGTGLARSGHPGFADGWALLPLPPPHPYPVLLAALMSAVVLGAAAALAAVAARREPAP